MLHKRLRLLLLLALGGALLLFGAGIASAIVSFSDVPQDHRFHHEIMSLANANVVDGYSDGTFRPGEPVLRQQMAKMIVLAPKSLSLIHISEPTRLRRISYAALCLKK